MTPDQLFNDDGLIGGLCAACGERHFPLTSTCPWCGGDAVSQVTLSTEGRLWAWTAVNAAPPGYEGDVPYGFGVVELPADRLGVVTRLTEPDPERLHEGMPMRFTVVDVNDTVNAYAFSPAPA